MPRKVRQLKQDLRRLGFHVLPVRGKGSHEMWSHPLLPHRTIVVSGHNGDDADRYQEKFVRDAAEDLRALGQQI